MNNEVKIKFYIASLFPDVFLQSLKGVIYGAIDKGIVEIIPIDLKQYCNGHIDGRPVSGGPGMIMRADLLDKIMNNIPKCRNIYPSPQGKQLNSQILKELSKEKEIFLLCGRYEGVDSRFLQHYSFEEISIGDFIVSGGEIPTLLILDGIIRLLDGVLNNHESLNGESFSNNLLEYDQYTKPIIWRGYQVPKILTSGNHFEIKKFNLLNSIFKTKQIRYDLYLKFILETYSLIILKNMKKYFKIK